MSRPLESRLQGFQGKFSHKQTKYSDLKPSRIQKQVLVGYHSLYLKKIYTRKTMRKWNLEPIVR